MPLNALSRQPLKPIGVRGIFRATLGSEPIGVAKAVLATPLSLGLTAFVATTSVVRVCVATPMLNLQGKFGDHQAAFFMALSLL